MEAFTGACALTSCYRLKRVKAFSDSKVVGCSIAFDNCGRDALILVLGVYDF